MVALTKSEKAKDAQAAWPRRCFCADLLSRRIDDFHLLFPSLAITFLCILYSAQKKVQHFNLLNGRAP